MSSPPPPSTPHLNEREFSLIPNGKAGRVGGTPILRKSYKPIALPLVSVETPRSSTPPLPLLSTPDEITWLPKEELHELLCKILGNEEETVRKRGDQISQATMIQREIQGKLGAHRAYDRSKGYHESLASINDIVFKMMIQNESCFYCHRPFHVLYRNKYDPFQWSLDRVNNSRGHTADNTVITCLRCNLQRRTREAKDFYRDRNLRIEKED